MTTRRAGAVFALALSGLLFFPGASAQPAGGVATVELARGEVQANGAPIFAGQRILRVSRLTTGPRGQLLLRFDDGMRVVLGENTQFHVVDFRYGGVGLSDGAVFDLLRGASRIVTGEVARTSPGQFFLRVGQASFSVRGAADFTVALADRAYLDVAMGTVIVSNAGGTIAFDTGTTAAIANSATVARSIPASALPPRTASSIRTLTAVAVRPEVEVPARPEPQVQAAPARPAPRVVQTTAEPARPVAAIRPPAFWIGLSGGQARFDEDITKRLITAGTVDGTDTGFKLFGGYQFNQVLGFELAYVDLGQVTYSGSFSGTPVTDGKLDVAGFNLSVLARLGLSERFALFGKLGMFIWQAEANDVAGGVPFSAKTDGSDISFGLGLSYDVSRALALRAEMEGLKIGDESAKLLSIGLVYKF